MPKYNGMAACLQYHAVVHVCVPLHPCNFQPHGVKGTSIMLPQNSNYAVKETGYMLTQNTTCCHGVQLHAATEHQHAVMESSYMLL